MKRTGLLLKDRTYFAADPCRYRNGQTQQGKLSCFKFLFVSRNACFANFAVCFGHIDCIYFEVHFSTLYLHVYVNLFQLFLKMFTFLFNKMNNKKFFKAQTIVGS